MMGSRDNVSMQNTNLKTWGEGARKLRVLRLVDGDVVSNSFYMCMRTRSNINFSVLQSSTTDAYYSFSTRNFIVFCLFNNVLDIAIKEDVTTVSGLE